MLSRTQGFVAAVVVGVLALSGVAWAEDGEPVEEPADAFDTGFNFGYDEIFHLFVFNLWDNADGPWDCSVDSADAETTYGVVGEGDVSEIVVGELTIDGESAAFDSTDDEADPPIEPLEYGVDTECTMFGVEVSGPNGQVNHGMFMKLFNSMWDGGPGRGCVNRHLAQSELGKGDQQVTVSEAEDADFTPVADGDTGEVSFTSVVADCKRDKGPRHPDDGEDESEPGRGRGHNKGRGQHAKHDDADDGESGNSNVRGNGNGRGNGDDDGEDTSNRGNSGNGRGRGHDR